MTAGGRSGASPVRVGPILGSRLRHALGVESPAVGDPVERRSANAQRSQSLMDCLGTRGRVPHTGARWHRVPSQPRGPVPFCATAGVLGESPKEGSKPAGERISRSSRLLMGQSSSLVDRANEASGPAALDVADAWLVMTAASARTQRSARMRQSRSFVIGSSSPSSRASTATTAPPFPTVSVDRPAADPNIGPSEVETRRARGARVDAVDEVSVAYYRQKRRRAPTDAHRHSRRDPFSFLAPDAEHLTP